MKVSYTKMHKRTLIKWICILRGFFRQFCFPFICFPVIICISRGLTDSTSWFTYSIRYAMCRCIPLCEYVFRSNKIFIMENFSTYNNPFYFCGISAVLSHILCLLHILLYDDGYSKLHGAVSVIQRV